MIYTIGEMNAKIKRELQIGDAPLKVGDYRAKDFIGEHIVQMYCEVEGFWIWSKSTFEWLDCDKYGIPPSWKGHMTKVEVYPSKKFALARCKDFKKGAEYHYPKTHGNSKSKKK